MKVLILGGTRFVGKHITQAALDRGHTITLFNRGKSNPDLFPGVERLHGDRDGGLDALDGRTWDAVIDVNGYVPRIVRASAEKLKGAAQHYTFISTVSVYAQMNVYNQDESAPVATLADPTVEQVTGETYGGLKVLCENAVLEVFDGRALVIRPGLVVGPDDPTDRYTYWPVRIAQGGEVLAPEGRDTYAQYIDVRDLGEWTVRMVEQQSTGIFNGTGAPMRFGDVLNACKAASGSDAALTWVPAAFLLEKEVQPWAELPMWIPKPDDGLNTTSSQKAVAAGLTYRDPVVTARDTLIWHQSRPAEMPFRLALAPEKEQAVLAAWKAAQG